MNEIPIWRNLDLTVKERAAAVLAAYRADNGADLSGAYLSGAYLSGAYLRGAYLSGAYLRGADLSGAYLRGAYLRGAYLRGAYLSGADLSVADLSGADLGGAYLSGADLSGADLSGADGILRIGPIGSRNGELIASYLFPLTDETKALWQKWASDSFVEQREAITKDGPVTMIRAGCFNGTLAEFKERVEAQANTTPDAQAEYRAIYPLLDLFASKAESIK